MSGFEVFPGYIAPLGVGTIPVEDLLACSGLEILQRAVAGAYPLPSIGARLNYTIVEVEEGRAVFRGLPSARHLNPVGGVHGSWAAAILDSAMACAIQSTLGPGLINTTAEFKINLTRPITVDTGEVRCEGKVISKGRTLATSEGRLFDGKDRLLAFGTQTCAVFQVTGLTR